MYISSAQCRAARALLDWTQDQLAEAAQVARPTIADFERNVRIPMKNNLLSIANALEAAGVKLIHENSGGVGVQFREIKLEYSRAVKAVEEGIIIPVRYSGQPYSILIPETIINDIDRKNHNTVEEQVKVVQNNLPVFLIAAEKILSSEHREYGSRIVLTFDKLPKYLF